MADSTAANMARFNFYRNNNWIKCIDRLRLHVQSSKSFEWKYIKGREKNHRIFRIPEYFFSFVSLMCLIFCVCPVVGCSLSLARKRKESNSYEFPFSMMTIALVMRSITKDHQCRLRSNRTKCYGNTLTKKNNIDHKPTATTKCVYDFSTATASATKKWMLNLCALCRQCVLWERI